MISLHMILGTAGLIGGVSALMLQDLAHQTGDRPTKRFAALLMLVALAFSGVSGYVLAKATL